MKTGFSKGKVAFAMLLSVIAASSGAVVPTADQMKGPFPIMSTTYFEDGRVDYDGLVREARFVHKSGCPGCIWGQSNDAVDLLTREEKRRCFEACATAVEGLDITLALGANGSNTVEMLEIARDIEAVAARHPTARIAMSSRPPDDVRTQADIEKAWDALAEVARRPVIFQTFGTPETPTPEVALLVRLAERHPEIYGYIKEEASGYAAVERMYEENRFRPAFKTLMAGWGGWQMLMQMRHCGCEGLVTERCAYAPLLGKLWRVYRSGERGVRLAEAFAMFRLLCDQRNFPEGLRGYHLYLLEKEGVFRNRISRQYTKVEVKDAGSFGVGREWKLVDVELTDLQKKELDLLYEDMMAYAGMKPAADDPYLDVMEAAVSAYSDEHIEKYVRDVEEGGVREHGFPRLTANLGVLLSEGRQTGRKDVFRRMMDISCREAAKGRMKGWGGGNDFSVKELAISLVALEKAGLFPESVTAEWRAALKSVCAADCYTAQPEVGAKRACNWCIFGAASEQARLAAGLGGDGEFVERYVSDQLRWFDENGMYRDPDQPVVYDLVTRLQFAAILHYWYDGVSRAKLEGLMDRSADATLAMLSACGEIPYGGRSNGFLHNNTFYSALCEWYAARYAKRGDADRAARFRAAARRSLAALEEWLAVRPVRHVKNLYPRETGYGCEDYAYFDKYMVTMGSWAMMAREFARDAAFGDAPTEEKNPSYFVTSKDFHLVLLNAGDYTAELDYNADPHYDSDGLGRFCRADAPPAICLSAPCAKKPFYALERANEMPLALLPVTEAKLEFVRCETEGGEVRSNWRLGDLRWTVGLSAAGLRSTLKGPGEVALALPAFDFDGETRTDTSCDGRELTIAYKGWVCRYVANGGEISESGVTCCNRNGRYRRFVVRGNGRLEVTVAIERMQTDDREARLKAALPDLFKRAAVHYRRLDSEATAQRKDAKGGLRVPHSFDPATARLDMRSVRWWTSGHFPGSLWYLYEATGETYFRDRAREWTETLAENAKVTDNHDVGFIMGCSYGNARRLLKTDAYDGLLLGTAASLSRRFNPRLGLIRSWGALDEKQSFEVIPDNMMNLEILEWAAKHGGGDRFDAIARTHADTTDRHHFRDDSSVYHVLDYDQSTLRVKSVHRGQGASTETAWSRGQSWAIYGYAMMYRGTGERRYLDRAVRCADFAMGHPAMPSDGVPYWDYGAPGEERDSSAASVMASGLLELSQLLKEGRGARYRAFAVKQLLSLSSPAYFAAEGENGGFILKHGTGNKPVGKEIDVPLDYGDYYYLEALVRFRRLVEGK